MVARDDEVARKKIAAVAKWKASGLSQADFCRHEGLAQWQLSEWKRFVEARAREAAAKPVKADKKPSRSADRAGNRGGQSGRSQPSRTQARPQAFVPVTVVGDLDIVGGAPEAVNDFNCVLEIVLPGGRMLRVSQHCRPEFLGAAVSALETC